MPRLPRVMVLPMSVSAHPGQPTPPRTPPRFRDHVLDAARAWQRSGARVCLATLVAVDGASPRPLGAQMAVREDGTALGFISGGCIEAAIIEAAREALAARMPVLIPYGEDSGTFDLRLPCGSRIEIAYTPDPDGGALDRVARARAARTPVALAVGRGTDTFRIARAGDECDPRLLVKPVEPPWHLIVAGDGPIIPALCHLAGALEIAVTVLTGSPEDAREADTLGAEVRTGHTGHLARACTFDPWTAFLTVYHDHDKELAPLSAALLSDCGYIGALGSRTTHANRIRALTAAGIGQDRIARIHAPVGLAIGAATPVEIALSVMAELTAVRRAATVSQARALP